MTPELIASLATALGTLIGAAIILSKARDEVQTIRAEREKIEAEREKIEAERGKIESEREDLEACASEKITAAALSLIEPLEKSVTKLEAARQQLQDRVVVLEEEREKLQRQISKLAQERVALLDRVRDFEARISVLEEENAELWHGVNELTVQIEDEFNGSPRWRPKRRSS